MLEIRIHSQVIGRANVFCVESLKSCTGSVIGHKVGTGSASNFFSVGSEVRKNWRSTDLLDDFDWESVREETIGGGLGVLNSAVGAKL